ncbi:hypothetical protein V8C35DRAFT_289917 [Trichoderma chlorosporum]
MIWKTTSRMQPTETCQPRKDAIRDMNHSSPVLAGVKYSYTICCTLHLFLGMSCWFTFSLLINSGLLLVGRQHTTHPWQKAEANYGLYSYYSYLVLLAWSRQAVRYPYL